MTGARDPLAGVGVVIVTHASSTTIGHALGALPTSRLAGVVVVDNASPDDTSAVVRHEHPHVSLVARTRNDGFAAGCNHGVAALGACESVLLLNPDAVIDAPALARLATHLRRYPRCGMVGPRLVSGGEPLTSSGRTPSLWTEFRLVTPRPVAARLPDRRHPPGHAPTGPVGYVEGACMLVRAAALAHVGGLDAGYFLFYEELDLARRMAAGGYTVELCADATAEHTRAVSRRVLPLGGRVHLVQSAERYLRTWHGPAAAALYRGTARATWRLKERRGTLAADEARLLRGTAR